MLNVKALNRLLTDNADSKLFPLWFLTTPNGSLLAYTSPSDIRELRDQVGLVSAIWREQNEARRSKQHRRSKSDSSSSVIGIHTITLEFDSRNVLVREVQHNILLVLQGGVPPGRAHPLHVTAETQGDARYPADSGSGQPESQARPDASEMPQSGPGALSPSGISTASASSTATRHRVLDLHRRKMDAMTSIIREEFAKTNFTMPSTLEDRYF